MNKTMNKTIFDKIILIDEYDYSYNYFKLDTKHDIDNDNIYPNPNIDDTLMNVEQYFYKKYMCMRCFYQTNDIIFFKEHLYMKCKKINGNCNTNYIYPICIYKK